MSRSSTSMKCIFNNFLLSELLLNEKLLNIYLITIDKRDDNQNLKGYVDEIKCNSFL